jgi:hypothetical protein
MAAAPFSSSGAALAEERGQAVAAAQAMLAKAQAVCFDVDSTVITEVRGEWREGKRNSASSRAKIFGFKSIRGRV